MAQFGFVLQAIISECVCVALLCCFLFGIYRERQKLSAKRNRIAPYAVHPSPVPPPRTVAAAAAAPKSATPSAPLVVVVSAATKSLKANATVTVTVDANANANANAGGGGALAPPASAVGAPSPRGAAPPSAAAHAAPRAGGGSGGGGGGDAAASAVGFPYYGRRVCVAICVVQIVYAVDTFQALGLYPWLVTALCSAFLETCYFVGASLWLHFNVTATLRLVRRRTYPSWLRAVLTAIPTVHGVAQYAGMIAAAASQRFGVAAVAYAWTAATTLGYLAVMTAVYAPLRRELHAFLDRNTAPASATTGGTTTATAAANAPDAAAGSSGSGGTGGGGGGGGTVDVSHVRFALRKLRVTFASLLVIIGIACYIYIGLAVQICTDADKFNGPPQPSYGRDGADWELGAVAGPLGSYALLAVLLYAC